VNFIPNHTRFTLDPAQLSELALDFASNPLYLDNEEWENEDNPFRRQLRPQIIKHLDFSKPLPRDQILDYTALAANRLLATVYETDMMFLPKHGLDDAKWADLRRFYSATNRARGEMIRPYLEQHVFGFLDEVEVSGKWTKESLAAYLGRIQDLPTEPSASETAILASSNPQRAARNWLIQFAPDFLSEASPMIRNVMGYYGPVQSDWFKVIIDEYGYGVHETKHSTLFENTMTSVGLSADLHRYWQYYLTSSLMMSNYFHYLGKNHELFFRYLGALYYTETTLVPFCDRAARLLTDVFGETADVTYFTEHVHIDTHHGRMALEKLIMPIVDYCGESVIPEIVRGFEEFQLVAQIADDDFAAQVDWMDAGPQNKQLHEPVWGKVEKGEVTAPVAHIVSGTMKFVSGYDSHQILEPGQGTVIWRNRLHGAIIESDECVYEIHSVGDYRACLS
jgi:Iron-containing redox enzyme